MATIIQFLSVAHQLFLHIAPQYTPLLLACRWEKWGVVRTLLDCGAPVNVLDGNQMSPLYFACLSNKLPIIRLLMKAGADPTLGMNPLDSSDVSQEAKDLIRSLWKPEPLDTPQPTFIVEVPGGGTVTITSCLLIHKLCATGNVDEVVRRKEEITNELLKRTGKVDSVDGVRLFVCYDHMLSSSVYSTPPRVHVWPS